MIAIENFPAVLTALGFKEKCKRHSKTVGTATLKVRFDTQEIVYPESAGLVINERQTCNFSSRENFVVLECMHRLLTKGYKPEHIELEPKWQMGRGARSMGARRRRSETCEKRVAFGIALQAQGRPLGAAGDTGGRRFLARCSRRPSAAHAPSGGRADILVKNNPGRPLLIIECKTASNEFKRAWTKTLLDGDQLLSDAQQISETQFLCLYTSYLDNGALRYTSHIVAHRDNPGYLADNPLFKGFHTATDVKERHAVWRDTYKLDYTTKGLFEDNIQPYHIGMNKYTLDDLHAFGRPQMDKQIAVNLHANTHTASGALRDASKWNTLDNLVQLVPDSIDPSGHSGDVLYIGLEHVEGGIGILLTGAPSSFESLKSTKRVFKAGDILYGKRRPNLNKVHLAESDGICSTEFLVLRANRAAEAELVRDYLLSAEFNQRVLSTVAGQQLPRTSWAAMRSLPAPRLSVEEGAQCVLELRDGHQSLLDARYAVSACEAGIQSSVSAVYEQKGEAKSIDAISLDVQYGLNEQMNESGIGYKIFRMNEIVQRRMLDGGQMKCADISAEEFAKYRLNRGDLLFNRTNSIEHVGKTGMFDLDGNYCFASYLVRVVPDTSKVLPEFLVLMMNSAAFQAEAKGKASKSINQANINATVMRNIKVPVPPLAEQKRLAAKVQALEQKIAEAQAVIAGAPARKQAILQRYL